jgi:4-amino-4-deoxy-L-arabinose transferase-like glycosyltransferase
LTAILVVAVFLRVLGLTWGLSDAHHLFSFHPDEYHSLRGFFAVLVLDPNPHFFNYGSLYLYLASLCILVLHPGASTTAWLQQLMFGDSGQLLRTWTLDARLATLAAALVTVYLAWRLGRRLWGERAGLLTAALVAILPLHVLLSHYATVDVTQSLFIVLALYLSVGMVERADWRTCLWAGAAAGLAASTKYNGGLVILAPALSAVLAGSAGVAPVRLVLKRWALLLAGAALAFALTSPYTFLAWPEASAGIRFELQHMRVGEGLSLLADPSGLLYHVKELLAPGMGLLFLLGLFGAGWSLYRRDRRAYPLVLFALIWLVTASLARVRYPRYELPLALVLVPLALAPLAGEGRLRRAWPALLGVAAALMLLWSVQIGVGLSRPDPHLQALDFLLLRPGAVGLVSEPWYSDPPVDYYNGGLGLLHNQQWARLQRPLRPLAVTGVSAPALEEVRPLQFVTTDFDVSDGLRARDPATLEFMAALRGNYSADARFGGVPLSLVPWPVGPDWRYPWPEITIWLPTAPA